MNNSFKMWQLEYDKMLAEVKTCVEDIKANGFTVTWNRKAMRYLCEKGYKVRYIDSQDMWEVTE